MDIYGMALLDYQKGNYYEYIITYSSLDENDMIPVPYLFRTFNKMPAIERKALRICKGKVLDIGCGAGSHSLFLKKKGFDVTSLDNSKGAIETCRLRGIKHTVHSDILDYNDEKYDTLLLLMNGIGLAGKLINLKSFLLHLKSILNPEGQIILDSTDIIYMFDIDDDGGYWVPEGDDYYGEVTFTMEYKKEKSAPFTWLYLDFNTLQNAAIDNGFNCEFVMKGEHYDYLARLTRI